MVGCGGEATPPPRPPIEVAPSPDSPSNPPKEIAEDPKDSPQNPIRVAPAYGAPPTETPTAPPAAAYGAPPPVSPPVPRP